MVARFEANHDKTFTSYSDPGSRNLLPVPSHNVRAIGPGIGRTGYDSTDGVEHVEQVRL